MAKSLKSTHTVDVSLRMNPRPPWWVMNMGGLPGKALIVLGLVFVGVNAIAGDWRDAFDTAVFTWVVASLHWWGSLADKRERKTFTITAEVDR